MITEGFLKLKTMLSCCDKTVVLVGLMGSGKSAIGRRLAARLEWPFIDTDTEIEVAAGCSIDDFFNRYGEEAFREGERKVIARLLEKDKRILSTGGGAFMDPETRKLIKVRGISIWLRAELDILVRRTARRDNRPLLKRGDPRRILADLMEQRYPTYAEADIIVDTDDDPPEVTTDHVIASLDNFLCHQSKKG
ncbi:MAG: shikimate kinase [Alphaproteobacteria bacterium]